MRESAIAASIGASEPLPASTVSCVADGPDGAELPHGVAAATALPWTRSVVRPGVPAFGVPLPLNCSTLMTYQPERRLAGRLNVELMRPDGSGAKGAPSTCPERVLRRMVTALAVADVL